MSHQDPQRKEANDDRVNEKLPDDDERLILSMVRFAGIKPPMMKKHFDPELLKEKILKRMKERGHSHVDLAVFVGYTGDNKQLSKQGSRVLSNLANNIYTGETLDKLLDYAGIYLFPMMEETYEDWEQSFDKKDPTTKK